MSVRITYFVHGTTVDNENEVSSGWRDAKLSEKGVRQALELKGQTKHLKFDAVFCSDLSRAVESAELAWKGVYPLFRNKRLRECNYGDYNGEPASQFSHAALRFRRMIEQGFLGGRPPSISIESAETRSSPVADYCSPTLPLGGTAENIFSPKSPNTSWGVPVRCLWPTARSPS